jgi:hypothetical protein
MDKVQKTAFKILEEILCLCLEWNADQFNL